MKVKYEVDAFEYSTFLLSNVGTSPKWAVYTEIAHCRQYFNSRLVLKAPRKQSDFKNRLTCVESPMLAFHQKAHKSQQNVNSRQNNECSSLSEMPFTFPASPNFCHPDPL